MGMRADLQKRVGGMVEIIYMDREGKLTHRRIRIAEVTEEDVKAFCYLQRGPRVFRIERILAVAPAGAARGTRAKSPLTV